MAVNLLWEKANYYKKVEDWTNLTATLEQLAKLQPNFITFWKFQAWNLTYNVSVEFDDYHDRYYYVRRGIQFLQEGEHYNTDNPQLLWDLGWFVGQKIGRADEYVQYRKLFKADDAVEDVLFFERRPKGRRGLHDGLIGMARLAAALRAGRFDAFVLLHHGHTLAFAALAAGIPERLGYGVGLQRVFLNRGPRLRAESMRLHPFERASAWLAGAGIELADAEPRLAISPEGCRENRFST